MRQSFSESIRSAVVSEEQRQALDHARLELPDQPLKPVDLAQTEELQQWEVVVAYNLDYPWRYAQEFFWLEVLGSNEQEAIAIAAEWVSDAHEYFEATDFVRPSSPHERKLGLTPVDPGLEIAWNMPIDQDIPPRTMVRDPMTGLRVGFIAEPEQEQKWLAKTDRGRYRLLVRKPVSSSDPVCLAPLVKNMGPTLSFTSSMPS